MQGCPWLAVNWEQGGREGWRGEREEIEANEKEFIESAHGKEDGLGAR